MTEITLADYTGYIFLEIIKARQMADAYSYQIAEMYAKDKILQYFSVPRFKVPKMELTIPVLISGARFKQVIQFKMKVEEFVSYIHGLVNEAISTVRRSSILTLRPVISVNPIPIVRPNEIEGVVGQLATDFWVQLRDNPDPSQPIAIVREMWLRIFVQALTDAKLEEIYRKSNPNDELFNDTLNRLLLMITTNTAIDRTVIQSLLVSPETNVVKNGSSETSVFTIKAEMQEEGIFIREVKDESTDETRQVVEFE